MKAEAEARDELLPLAFVRTELRNKAREECKAGRYERARALRIFAHGLASRRVRR